MILRVEAMLQKKMDSLLQLSSDFIVLCLIIVRKLNKIVSKGALTDRELELVGRSIEVNSKPFQMRPWSWKLGSLFTFIVLVKQTPKDSSTGWDWVARPVRARWKCSLSRSHSWDSSPVGLLLAKLDPMVVICKL